jgi:hypothetical protein
MNTIPTDQPAVDVTEVVVRREPSHGRVLSSVTGRRTLARQAAQPPQPVRVALPGSRPFDRPVVTVRVGFSTVPYAFLCQQIAHD